MNDYFGKDASELNNKKLWLFDMDGTIYEEEKVFDGTIELLGNIIDQEGKYIYTLEVDIYSGYNYPTGNAYAYGFEAEMDVLQGANVKAGFGFKIHYDGYYELLEQCNITVVESAKGQVLIHTGTGNSPHLYLTFVVDPNDGYRTDVTLDVGYPSSYEYDG